MKPTNQIERRLKLRDLRMVMAVAQHGSMARAAHHLAISQPVVSKTITALEQTLGVRLFDRGPQGVEPTQYGEALLQGGVAVFDELRQSMQRMQVLADPGAGETRIGTVEFLAGGLVFAVIDKLISEYPRAAFHVTVTDGSPSLLQELRERKVEVALGRIAAQTNENDFDVQPFLDEQLYVVAGVGNPWARRRKVKLADLLHEPWSLPPPESLAGQQIADFFRENDLAMPRARVTSYSIQLHTSLLTSGRVIAMIPGSFLHHSASRRLIKILPVQLHTKPRSVAIITLRNRTISPLAQAFIDRAREYASTLKR